MKIISIKGSNVNKKYYIFKKSRLIIFMKFIRNKIYKNLYISGIIQIYIFLRVFYLMVRTKEGKSMNFKGKIRKKSGITLISLVVTIIILLILAGITIATITSNNGIIKNANDAKEQTEIAEEKEIVDRASLQAMGNNKRGNLVEDELQEELDKITDDGNTEVSDGGENIEIIFINSNRYYTVDKDGNIIEEGKIVIDKSPGDITKDENGDDIEEGQPYEIWSIEDLCDFSNRVNNGKTFSGEEVNLMQSLNFKSKSSYVNGNIVTTGKIQSCNTIEELEKIVIEGEGFCPIGDGINNNSYQGVFDGKNFTIKNLYINRSGDIGLFGRISNGAQNDIVIKNTKITGNITGTECAGAICGCVMETNSNIQIINCTNNAEINGEKKAGGIIGCGGSGATGLIIQNCTNYGNVKSSNVGGIIGECYYIEIYNCYNDGEIVGISETGYSGVGGIVGTGVREIVIKNSYNKGNIKGISKGGGIIGYNDWGELTLENCYNIGSVSATVSGGIVGRAFLSNDMLTTKNCFYLNTNNTIGIGSIHEGGSEEKDGVEGISYEEIKSNEFLSKLNDYVKQNSNNQEVELKKWKIGNEGYPILE